MKNLRILPVIFTVLIIFSSVSAQEENAPETKNPARPNALRVFNLSAEQIKQIRRINTENRQATQAAQNRHEAAVNALDEAIYAENLDENVVKEKLKELHAAQNEMFRLKIKKEIEIRKILTPDQLVKFREMRENMRLRRQKFQKPAEIRPFPNQNRPNTRFINRQKNRRF